MTKSELIATISNNQPHLPQKDVEYAVNNIIDGMITTLVNGDRIEIRGFGAFSIVQYSARIGRNPKTGEAVSVPERRSVHFKTGLELRKKVDASRVVYPVIKDL
jgi:integration host factor subunit beta